MISSSDESLSLNEEESSSSINGIPAEKKSNIVLHRHIINFMH